MKNASTVLACRLAGLCLPSSRCTEIFRIIRPLVPTLLIQRSIRRQSSIQPWAKKESIDQPVSVSRRKLFSTSARTQFQRSFVGRNSHIGRENEEKGLAFRERDLESTELEKVFGKRETPPPRITNRFLRVLHGRRNDGTLDLPLPPSLHELTLRYPHAIDAALAWLRSNYPIDEDAAILARIEREESNQEYSPTEFQQQAQDVGLYKPQSGQYSGPQSGRYQAQLSEKEEDVFGQSTIDEMRAEHLATAEREEAELQAQIDERMAHITRMREEKLHALEVRPEQMLETSEGVRPPNEYERWVMKKAREAQSEHEIPPEMTLRQRLLPSAVFTALVCTGCYLYAQYWVPPMRKDRIYPDLALSFATIAALIGINCVVRAAWLLPPFWKILNRYFVSTPGFPRPLSLLGNTISHMSTRHLFANMLGLTVFGLDLHEDVGRGTFLGIYIASGVAGGFFSLLNSTLRGIFVTSSLGASGGVWGLVGAYCWLHGK
jgi:rhomboid-like protein